MGYIIEFKGKFNLNKPLSEEHAKFLYDFSRTRHYERLFTDDDPNGLFFTDPDGIFEPSWKDLDFKEICINGTPFDRKKYELSKWGCIDFNNITPGMPSFYCQWIPTEDRNAIEWDKQEKFYNAKEWLEFLIKHYLILWGYTLNGEVKVYDNNDHELGTGILRVLDNEVFFEKI